ncbi:hypothetical protein NE237_011385 [Protea cynaroides]|uniref:Xyloglucan endotransglucosylase/hydrolase n=1 Tax=Protea cynaroides TaxID=273540 RepID=A0A9Q0JWZ8_9MAGN|nr:hypothetical protein NE237_011385 [Protea cynaroides]
MPSMLLLGLLLASSLMAASAGDLSQDFFLTGVGGQILDNGQLLMLSLDNTTGGSGFESMNTYLFGRFDMDIKLVPGNSAGTVTTFYLSSQGSHHDEIDFEFLGNLSGDPYTVHTNVFSQGIGGREMQFQLWFDPTLDFHTYTFIWNSEQIIFMVDNIPIREFKNRESEGLSYPNKQPMTIYSSLWDGEEWATRGGAIKTNWTEAPFKTFYKNFNGNACLVSSSGVSSCDSKTSTSSLSWQSQQLNSKSRRYLRWVQKHYMIYNYCTDHKRFSNGFPRECRRSKSH